MQDASHGPSCCKTNKTFSFFQAPFLALFSRDFYSDVASNWKGWGALYLLFILALSSLINCGGVAYLCYKGVTAPETRSFFANLPMITLKEGQISIDKPYPYNLKDSSGAYTIATFVKERDPSELTDADPMIIVTSNSVLMRNEGPKGPTVVSAKDLQDISTTYPNLVISGSYLMQMLDTAWIFVPLLMFALGLPLLFIAHFLQLLIYGGLTMVMAGALSKTITYNTAVRLAAMAITPCVLVSTIVTLLPILGIKFTLVHQIWPFASIAVALGYMYMACTAINNAPTNAAPTAVVAG